MLKTVLAKPCYPLVSFLFLLKIAIGFALLMPLVMQDIRVYELI